MLETEIETEPQLNETIENNSSSIDRIDETAIQEFPDMLQDTPNPEEEKKDEKVIISVEECENLYGCLLEAGHGIVATGKGKSHRDLPLERRKAQGKLLHRLIEKYNIQVPAELDIIIVGAGVVADWQFMGSGSEGDSEVRDEIVHPETVEPELGGVITTDAKAIEENSKIESKGLN